MSYIIAYAIAFSVSFLWAQDIKQSVYAGLLSMFIVSAINGDFADLYYRLLGYFRG